MTQGERDAHIMSALGGDDRALTGAVPAYTCDPPKKAPADFVPPKNTTFTTVLLLQGRPSRESGQCGSCWAFGYSYMSAICVQTGRWNVSSPSSSSWRAGGRLLQRRYRRSRREGSGQGLGHGQACPEGQFAYERPGKREVHVARQSRNGQRSGSRVRAEDVHSGDL